MEPDLLDKDQVQAEDRDAAEAAEGWAAPEWAPEGIASARSAARLLRTRLARHVIRLSARHAARQ